MAQVSEIPAMVFSLKYSIVGFRKFGKLTSSYGKYLTIYRVFIHPKQLKQWLFGAF